MGLKATSQDLLASALKTLLSSDRSLDDIRVEHILKLSGVSRATFYKYFYSKYELARYVFLNELANVSFFDYNRPLEEREVEILRHLDANRAFYRNALASQEFRDAWMQAAYKADAECLKMQYDGLGIDEDDLRLFAGFVSRAMVATTWLWVTDPCPYTPEELAHKLIAFVERGASALLDQHKQES